MEITGNIIAVLPARQGVSARTGNPWMTQQYVLEIPGNYPKHMCFSMMGEDRIKQFALQQGESDVTVQFEIDAREYEGKWYNDLRCYNIVRRSHQQPAPQAQQPSAANSPFPPDPSSEEPLPF